MNDLGDSHHLDGLLVDHLRRRADEATPLAQLTAIVAPDLTARVTPIDSTSPRARRGLLVAAAALAALSVGALVVVGTGGAQPGSSADAPAVPVQPAATIGNYVPSGALEPDDPFVLNSMYVEAARFDSDEASYARLVGPPDPASTTPGQPQTVITSVRRSMSIATGPIPATPNQTQANLDGLDVTVGTDVDGFHHLIELTRPGGNQARIEATGISLSAFLEVVDDLVYADPSAWSKLVDEVAARPADEVMTEDPFPGTIAIEEEVVIVEPNDDSGITLPAGTELPEPGVVADTLDPPDEPAITLPVLPAPGLDEEDPVPTTILLPPDVDPATTDPASPVTTIQAASLPQPGVIDHGPSQPFEGVGGSSMLVVDDPSPWTLSSAVVGEVDQSVWRLDESDGSLVTVAFTSATAPPVTVAPETFAEATNVFAGGIFESDPGGNGTLVRSTATGERHYIEGYIERDDSESSIQVSMDFRNVSLDDVADFLSAVRPVDRAEWERIASDL